MEDLFKTIRDFKTKAKNRRDLERYESGVSILKEEVIPLIKKEISSTSSEDLKMRLASELSDCLGLLGGISRRWALNSKTGQERALHLEESVQAYEEGYKIEKKPEFQIVDSYNMVNRLVSYILLEPDSILDAPSTTKTRREITYDVMKELKEAEDLITEQLKEKRRGDIWALADLALVTLLLNNNNSAPAYADFNAQSPPDYAYESSLSTLRPLAELKGPAGLKLKEAVKLLEAKLRQLQA